MIRLGPLVLAGGAEFLPPMEDADRAWLRLLAGEDPRIAVLPTAADRRPERCSYFAGLGFKAQPSMITTRAEAGEGEATAILRECAAAYMAGGSPSHLADTLRGSQAWLTLRQRWLDGMALGGSSAGAMVLCQKVLVQNRWREGLGLLSGAVVVPHFERRQDNELGRQFSELGLRGLGIDESTAMIWHGGRWTVAGQGRVVVLSGGQSTAFRAGEGITEAPPASASE